MAAANYFDQVQKIYIAFYQRPADPAGLAYWADRIEAAGGNTDAVVSAFANSPEATTLYGTINSTTIGGVVDQIFQALFNRAPDAAGKKFYVDGFNAGTFTPGKIALDVLNGAMGNDSVTLANKLLVANDFTQQVDGRAFSDVYFGTGTTFDATYAGNADAIAARGILAGVTADPATVLNPGQVTDLIKSDIANTGDAILGQSSGQTFTLTEAVDNIQGTAGDDTIVAGPGSAGGVHTLGASDVIDGGAGTDKIIITSAKAGGTGEIVVPRMSNVENVFAQNVGGNNTFTLNMVNATGVQQLWNDNSTRDVSVTNLQEKAAIGIKGGNGAGNDYTVQVAAPALVGDLAVVLDSANVNNVSVSSTGAANALGYASTTINATGTNLVNSLSVGNTLSSVVVAGTGSVAVNGDLAATVRTIDASGNTGGVNFNITNNTGDTTFTGGQGADRINFGSTLNLNDKVNGGAGRDILGVTDQNSIIAGLQVSNVEVLELNTLNGTLVASRIAGVDEVRVTNNLSDAAGQAIVNGLTSNSTFVTNDSGNVQLNIINAQVANTNDTLQLKTGITSNGFLGVMAAGVENVVYTQNNLAASNASTSLNFYDTDGVIDMSSLTIANQAGNSVFANNLVNTIKTVDASAAAGNLFMSVGNGNPTNGVAITGGSGNDFLMGGDGKDIIKGGAGSDGISGDLFQTILGTNGAPIQQVSTVTLANIEPGDTFSVNVNGTTYTAGTVAALRSAINLGEPVVSATSAGNVITLTGDANGTAFSIGGETSTNRATAPEVSTVTIASVPVYDAGDVVRVSINGANYDYTVLANGTTATTVAAGLQAQIQAGGQMTATVASNQLTLTGTDTSNFTIATSTVNGGTPIAAVPSVLTITPGDFDNLESLNVTLGSTTYSVGRLGLSVAATLDAFVTSHQVAINAATGGVLARSGNTLTITKAAGDGLLITDASGSITGGDGGTVTDTYTAGNPVYTLHNNGASSVADNAPAAAGVNNQTIATATTTQGQMTNNQYIGGFASSDTLTGDAGKDAFWFISGSSLSANTMDTITDLDLGGATGILGMDTIVLSKNNFSAFTPTDLINAGTALNMTGPTLAVAVQALFNLGGALSGSVNDVGLFTYGTDTYLIATNNAPGYDNSDVVIKVTGVTGTLDLSDIAVV